MSAVCTGCDGSGVVGHFGVTCIHCEGTGKERTRCISSKHLDQIVDSLRYLARHIEDSNAAGLVVCLGARDPVTGRMMLSVAIDDDMGLLDRYTHIGGMHQIGPHAFTFDKAAAMETMSMEMATVSANMMKNREKAMTENVGCHDGRRCCVCQDPLWPWELGASCVKHTMADGQP